MPSKDSNIVLGVSEGAEHDGGVHFVPHGVACPKKRCFVHKMNKNQKKHGFGRVCDNTNVVLWVSEAAEHDGGVHFVPYGSICLQKPCFVH